MPVRHGSLSASPALALSSFYRRRKELLDLRLATIAKMTQVELIIEVAAAHVKAGLKIHVQDLFRLQDLAAALTGPRLSKVLKSMIAQPETYSRGAPDLLFWKSRVTVSEGGRIYPKSVRSERSGDLSPCCCQDTECSPGHDSWLSDTMCELGPTRSKTGPWSYDSVFSVEVKSPKDSLSSWQMLWLQLLSDAGVPSEVCRVSY